MKYVFLLFTMFIAFTIVPLAQAQETDPVLSSYLGWNKWSGTCSKNEQLLIFRPEASGTFPVFIYAVGTGALVSSGEGELAAREMSKRGFVSAVLKYESGAGYTCDSMLKKAQCSYSGALSTSASSQLCNLPFADCNKGIVVAGLSQGANMAILANIFESRVRAAWLMAFGGGQVGNSYTQCFVDSATTLPANRLRVINGRDGQGQPLSNLQAATGTLCWSSQQSCFRSNGSGWFLVANTQVEDGHADHCYFVGADTDGSEIGCSTKATRLDNGWLGTQPWSLSTNLNWLTQFANQ